MTSSAQKPSRVDAAKWLRMRDRMESEMTAQKELILGDTKHDEHGH